MYSIDENLASESGGVFFFFFSFFSFFPGKFLSLDKPKKIKSSAIIDSCKGHHNLGNFYFF